MNTRFKTVAALVLTLLVGVIIGSLITGRAYDHRMRSIWRLRTSEGFTERMEEVIGTQDSRQRAAISATLKQTAVRLDTLNNQARRDRTAAIDSMERRLEPLLTPEQRERLAIHRERVKSRHKK